MSEPLFILTWRCDGVTLVLPAIDSDGDISISTNSLLDALEARGVPLSTVATAAWRGIAGERAGLIGSLRLELAEARDKLSVRDETIDAYRRGELAPAELEAFR